MVESVFAFIFGSVAMAGLVLMFWLGLKADEDKARHQRYKLDRFFDFLLEWRGEPVSAEEVAMFLEAMNEKK